jgi:hypothetical protein
MTAITTQSIDSYNSALSVNSQDITPAIIKVSFPSTWIANDITAFGSTGRRYGKGIDETTFTIDAMFNQVATTGSYTVLEALHAGTVIATFSFYPAGSGASNAKISGNLWVHKFEVVSQVGTFVRINAECLVDNGVSYGTAT